MLAKETCSRKMTDGDVEHDCRETFKFRMPIAQLLESILDTLKLYHWEVYLPHPAPHCGAF